MRVEQREALMSIVRVDMYRVKCDAEGCERYADEYSDYAGWADQEQALDEARDADFWVADQHFCLKHRPRCAGADCGWTLRPDDPLPYCEDCAEKREEM